MRQTLIYNLKNCGMKIWQNICLYKWREFKQLDRQKPCLTNIEISHGDLLQLRKKKVFFPCNNITILKEKNGYNVMAQWWGK